MMRINFKQFRLGLALVVLSLFYIGCSTQASEQYWGQIDVPEENKLRYITGSEPESMDPQFVTGQPEARIMIGLYDRLVEYHPKTMQPIPSSATHWDVSEDGTNYTFHLRKGAVFSNGDPITAEDYAWSFRRALSPDLASRYAFLGYDIKYAEAYNSAMSFVKKDGKFLLEKDFEPKDDGPVKDQEPDNENTIAEEKPDVLEKETVVDNVPGEVEVKSEPKGPAVKDSADEKEQSEFQKYINSPIRLTVPSDEEGRQKLLETRPELKSAFEGAEFVKITGDDLGVEAIDENTFRVTLKQSAPYFTGLLTHQFFAVLHKPTIEKEDWGDPANAPDIVVSGAYTVKEWRPYDELTIIKNPKYWDAENVTIEEIVFYPMDEQTTMMNIYKYGGVDALYNHTVPAAWNEEIRKYTDEYLLHPEMSIEYYTFSVKKPPVDKVEVRKAFALAIDREALEKYRKTVKKLVNFTPEGIFPEYEKARTEVYSRLLKENNISEEEWKKRFFDPERACKLMEEAGYTVKMKDGGKCDVTDFPADDMTISYNTAESNKQVAEFVQAQWKQNLGITVQIKNMEWKTYLSYRSAIEYTGAARAGWVGDFVDPYTFLSQFYTKNNDSSTGWWDPKFDKMLEEANNIRDPKKRFEKLAEAEFYMMQDQPVAPLSTAGTSWMKKPYVKGMYPNPGTMHPWKFVYIERDRSKWDKNVDEIMNTSDAKVDAQVEAIMKTQTEFEKSQQQPSKSANTAKAEE